MIVKEEFLNKLRRAFGLNLYEARIWTALLSRGVSTAGELSDIGNVPRSRAYDILESLEKKGFVLMKLGKPIKYLTVKPTEVIKRVKRSIEEKSIEHVKMLDNVESTDFFKELELLHKNGITHVDVTDYSGALKGRDNVYDHLESLLSNAKKNVVMMTTATGLRKKVEAFENVFKRLSSNGVKIRIIAPINKDNEYLVRRLGKTADVRSVDNIRARFCVIDGKELLFMVNDDTKVHENYDTGIWVSSEFMGNTLMNLFEYSWSKGK